ncbi:hypothetical protein Tco_0174499 [Tanacetum coccineum]
MMNFLGEALLEAKNDVDLWEAPLGAMGFSNVGWNQFALGYNFAEENEKKGKLRVEVEDYKAKRVEVLKKMLWV